MEDFDFGLGVGRGPMALEIGLKYGVFQYNIIHVIDMDFELWNLDVFVCFMRRYN